MTPRRRYNLSGDILQTASHFFSPINAACISDCLIVRRHGTHSARYTLSREALPSTPSTSGQEASFQNRSGDYLLVVAAFIDASEQLEIEDEEVQLALPGERLAKVGTSGNMQARIADLATDYRIPGCDDQYGVSGCTPIAASAPDAADVPVDGQARNHDAQRHQCDQESIYSRVQQMMFKRHYALRPTLRDPDTNVVTKAMCIFARWQGGRHQLGRTMGCEDQLPPTGLSDTEQHHGTLAILPPPAITRHQELIAEWQNALPSRRRSAQMNIKSFSGE
ncbi:hypothetical protein ON010_g13119 [Phytophthora cinnamomi]|nr:hypothetical protein ON010_g13119 [Phytophthora cinnamomi]